MPSFRLYGANPSELAQQQAQYDNLFTRTAESNRAAGADASRFNLQAWIQAQQANIANQQQAENEAVRAMQYRAQMAQAAAKEAEDRRRFDITRGDAATRLGFEDRRQNYLEQAEADRVRRDASNAETGGYREAYKRLSKPQPIESVDFTLLSKATGLPEETLHPMAEKADRDFAVQQAVNMNNEYRNQIEGIENPGGRGIPRTLSDDELKTIRENVERRYTDRHKAIKWDNIGKVWYYSKDNPDAASVDFTPPPGTPPPNVDFAAFGRQPVAPALGPQIWNTPPTAPQSPYRDGTRLVGRDGRNYIVQGGLPVLAP